MFDNEKKNALSKDKSKKGSIDKEILPIIELINSNKNYYTTSSCSGRIVLIKPGENWKKNKTDFLFVKHNNVNLNEIKNKLVNASGEIWIRQEPVIIHACSKTFEDANKLLKLARDVGFKRSGIIDNKKFIVEIMGTERIDTIIYKNKILVGDDYLKILIEESNKKLKRSRGRLKRFELRFRKLQNE